MNVGLVLSKVKQPDICSSTVNNKPNNGLNLSRIFDKGYYDAMCPYT